MEQKQPVILAVGAHIGDAELTAGGVLAMCAVRGGKAVTLALTGGERGVPPGKTVAEYRKQKEAEAAAFAEILGGESYVLPYTDGELPDTDAVKLEVCDMIRKIKPTVIMTHHSVSMHKDHMTCHRIVNDAWFYAALDALPRSLPAHFAPLYYAENWEDSPNFEPYAYFEVSKDAFALWQKAVSTHRFVTESTSFPYKEYYEHLMRLRGIENRTDYAQAFMIRPESMRVKESL